MPDTASPNRASMAPLPSAAKSLADNPLWKAFSEDACVSVVLYDLNGRIVFANRRCCEVANVTLVGLMPSEIMGEEAGKAIQDAVARVVAQNGPVAFEGNWHGARFLGVLRPLEIDGAKFVLGTFRNAADMSPEPWGSWHGLDVVRSSQHRGPLDRLTPRELDVFRLIGDGLPSLEVAENLGLSVKTVEWYRAQLGQKLGARNRVELARMAIAMGISASPTPATMNGASRTRRTAPTQTPPA